jgi:hypothetical protein
VWRGKYTYIVDIERCFDLGVLAYGLVKTSVGEKAYRDGQVSCAGRVYDWAIDAKGVVRKRWK